PAPNCPVVCLTVKPVGEPDAGDRHVRFDERGWETACCRMAQATAPILDSTKADMSGQVRDVRFWGESGQGSVDTLCLLVTHLRHWPDRNPAVQQPPWCHLRSMVENRFAFLTVSHQFDILRLRPLMLGLDGRHYLADRGPERAQLDRDIDRLIAASRRHGAGADHQRQLPQSTCAHNRAVRCRRSGGY